MFKCSEITTSLYLLLFGLRVNEKDDDDDDDDDVAFCLIYLLNNNISLLPFHPFSS